MHIESLRLDERLHVEWQIETDVTLIKIPLLPLQPLLENAIYHGIQPLAEGGTVRIHIFQDGEAINLRVSNPLGSDGAMHSKGNRMALENIRSRLEAIYGLQSSVTTRTDAAIYETWIQYPLENSQKV